MELLLLNCVFTGPVAVALGQLTYVLATAAGFTRTSSDDHLHVRYVIVETDGVSIGIQTN